MSHKPDVFTAFHADDSESKIETGDVALLLKKDGRVMGINFGYDVNRLMMASEHHTDEDRAMLEQGQKLFALTLAAQTPRLMSLLLQIASDPDVVDFDAIAAMTRKH